MCLIGLMHDSETVTPWVGVLVNEHFVALNVDVSFNFGFLNVPKVRGAVGER